MTPAYGQTQPLMSAPAMGRVTLPGTFVSAPAMGRVTLPGTYASAPAMGMSMSAPMMGAQATAPVLTSNGTYASNVGADGTYWEKTSGPTFFGDTLATQVICKRQLPTQVVNPVVNVPYAVPTPVATTCGPEPHAMHQGHNTRYGQQPVGRWTQ